MIGLKKAIGFRACNVSACVVLRIRAFNTEHCLSRLLGSDFQLGLVILAVVIGDVLSAGGV